MFSRAARTLAGRAGSLRVAVQARAAVHVVGAVAATTVALAATTLAACAAAAPASGKGSSTVVSAAVAAQTAQQIYSKAPLDVYAYLKDYLAGGGQESADVLWRLARAAHDRAAEEKNQEEKKRLSYEGYEAAKKALAMDGNNFACHKWMAIMISDIGDFEGLKQKLLNSYTMRDHFKRAIELNPTDATSVHLLGVWCFTFADLPWYQRKAASTIFATPPSSSYEEALSYFTKAEDLDPGFYPKNRLMLGKTLQRMGKAAEAKVAAKVSGHASHQRG